MNIDHHVRKYSTILDLVSEIGSITYGLMLIFGLFLSQWQKYHHDEKLA